MKLIEVFDNTSFEILEDTHGKPLRFGGEFQLADKKNQNGRIYSEALWNRALGSSKVQTRLKERSMVGELDHPASGKSSVRNIAQLVTGLELKESKRFPGIMAVYGVAECAPTPDGKILENLHRARYGVRVSSRGDGDLEERGGDSYVIPESYELDTFDSVMDPSVNVSVNVLESMAKETGQTTCTLKKALGAKSVENLVRAIYGIVESGDFDKSAAAYYQQILENVDKDDSETYLMATQALKELTEHLEVTKVMIKPAGTDAPASGLPEHVQQIQELTAQLEEANKKAAAGQALVQELLIQSRGLKMANESLVTKLKTLEPVATRFESAKSVITRLREAVLELQGEGKFRIAAEQLLGALLQKIEEAKVTAYVDRQLVSESLDRRKKMRPMLLRCESKTEVNKQLILMRSLSETRNARDLPPVNENGRRAERVPRVSALLENGNNGKNKQPVTEGQIIEGAINEEHSQQIDFTRRVLKVSQGVTQGV